MSDLQLTRRRAGLVLSAVIVNLAFLAPFWIAWLSAGSHVGVLNHRMMAMCIAALPGESDLPVSFAQLRFERPYVLRLSWQHVSDLDAVVLCEYDPGDGDEQPPRVVRAWVEER